MSARDFIAEVLPFARAESARTGIPVSVMLAQTIDETGAGTSSWWRQAHNPAGVGVTGQPGAGNVYPDVAAGWRDYANKLLGIGEAGQQQFVGDVIAHAAPPVLLHDLEAGPWAGGKYGGRLVNGVRQPGQGLDQIYAQYNLAQFDNPNATVPPGVVIPPSSPPTAQLTKKKGGGGIDLNPLDWIGNAVSGAGNAIVSNLNALALKIVFVIAGLALVVGGVWRAAGPRARTQGAAS